MKSSDHLHHRAAPSRKPDVASTVVAIASRRIVRREAPAATAPVTQDPALFKCLNTKQAVEFLGICERSLRGYRQNPAVPQPHHAGRRVYYVMGDLIAWIEAGRKS
jgi:hypothetical protein